MLSFSRGLAIAVVAAAAVIATLPHSTAATMMPSPSTSADWDKIFTSQNLTGSVSGWTGFEKSVYSKQFGYLNIPLKAPMPPDARYPIASNTKLYVALSLYQLMEKGKLNVTDSIADYLDETDFAKMGVGNKIPGGHYCPKVPGNESCQIITFVQLLDMSAGIADTDFQFLPYPGTLALVAGRTILAPLLFVPGSRYYYSNPAFMLGSYFIEKFSGMTFNEYIQTFICKPAGLTSTYFDPYNGKFGLDEKRVDEYYQFIDPTTKELSATGKCSSEFDLGSAAGAGGIVSTQEDEMRLYYQLFNLTVGAYGRPFLSNPNNLVEIIQPRTQINEGFFYAQGVFVLAANLKQKIPNFINYEGEIQCSHTSNVFDLTQTPPVMTQTWSNCDLYYASKAQLESITSKDEGSYSQIISRLPKRVGLTQLSMQLHDAIVNGGKNDN